MKWIAEHENILENTSWEKHQFQELMPLPYHWTVDYCFLDGRFRRVAPNSHIHSLQGGGGDSSEGAKEVKKVETPKCDG